MGHRIYLMLMIVLPLFVGFASICQLISCFSHDVSTMNPVFCFLFMIAGMFTGIKNIWDLILQSEQKDNKK